jgi:cytosine/adenosine deaminase-related metal-dependent hydrolase
MIVRARIVLTMDGAPIENGALAITGGRVADVGDFPAVGARNGGEVVDLGEQVLLPGLINTHCHLDYTCLRGRIPRQRSFTDWIKAINDAKNALSPDDYVQSIEAGFAEAQRFGTTSIVNLTAFPDLISRIRDPLRSWWCAELIDVRPRTDSAELLRNACNAVRATHSPLASRGIAPHAPYTASEELYRGASRAARDGLLCTTHVAESFEELQMFRYASGALFEFLAGIGRDMADCGSETPFARVGRSCGNTANWLLVHVNELADDDFALIEHSDALHVVHCPRSHAYFQHTRFAYERLRDAGANVCIGTDSLASAPDLSLLAELRQFRQKRPHVSAREALEMVTVNAARAIGQAEQLGHLARGALADVVAVPYAGATADAYEAIVAHPGPVSWAMLNGNVVAAA